MRPSKSLLSSCIRVRWIRAAFKSWKALHRKWPAPPGMLPGGAVVGGADDSAKGPVSRILSCAVIPLGAASPRTLISDLPGGFGNGSSRLERTGPVRSAAWLLAASSLPIWSCSVWGLPCPGLYRTGGALLPHHFTLTPALEFAATASEPGKPGQLGYCVSREALPKEG